MKNKLFILLIVLSNLFFYKISSAQNLVEGNSSKLNYCPPSPTVGELGKYGVLPVSHYSGVPDISIPLFNVNAGDFSLPIFMTYHASGIRVNDISSLVGLGWSLNAGGAISINVQGVSDFLPEYKLRRRDSIALLDNFDIPRTDTLRRIVSNGVFDLEPDIYSYNFCGYSGQFVVGEDGKAKFLKNSGGIKIFVNVFNPKEIRAIDTKGFQYVFKDFETSFTVDKRVDYEIYQNGEETVKDSHSYGHCGMYQPNITGVVLSYIVSPNIMDTISFLYKPSVTKYTTPFRGNLIASVNSRNYSTNVVDWYTGGMNYFVNPSDYIHVLKNSYIKHDNLYIKEIRFNRNNQKIVFNTNHQREDIEGTEALSSIELWINNELMEKWIYQYEYFVSDISALEKPVGQTSGLDNFEWAKNIKNPLHKRLKLKYLLKTGNNDTIRYTFNYYGENDIYKLPPRNSFDGSDIWGYCNKIVTPENFNKFSKLFPAVYSKNETDFICTGRLYQASLNGAVSMDPLSYFVDEPIFPPFPYGREWRPDSVYAKGFSLKEIIYPTGASTHFEYEGHVYTSIQNVGTGFGTCGGLRIKRIYEKDGSKIYNDRSFEYSGGSLHSEPIFIQSIVNGYYEMEDFMSCNCFSTTTFGRMYYLGNPRGGGYSLSSHSINPMQSFGGDYIGYRKVTEKTIDGSIEYTFVTSYDEPNIYSFPVVITNNYNDPADPYSYEIGELKGYVRHNKPVYPFNTGYTGKVFNRGKSTETAYFNKDGKIIKKQINNYRSENEEKVYGNEVRVVKAKNGHISNKLYYINSFYYNTGKSFLEKQISIDYFNNANDSIVTYTHFTNDIETELPLTIEHINPLDSLKKIFIYPFNLGPNKLKNQTINKMIRKRMLNYPIEETNYKNNKVISSALYNYSDQGNIIFQKELKNIEIIEPLENFNIVTVDNNGQIVHDVNYVIEASFNVHDLYGNPEEVHYNDNEYESYIWSKNSKNPIAKVSNSKRSQIAFANFEEAKVVSGSNFSDNEWESGFCSIKDNASYTGKQCFVFQGSNLKTKKSFPPGKYRIRMWTKLESGSSGLVTLSGQSGIFWNAGNKWQLKENIITLTNNSTIILVPSGGNILVDDISIVPYDSRIETFTYHPLYGFTSITDDNGNTLFYFYDEFGRLKMTKDHDGNIIESHEYHYAN